MERDKTGDDLFRITGGKYIAYAKFYNKAGFGSRFMTWVSTHGTKYNDSYGNGAAMRVSPVAYISDNLDTCLEVCDIVTKTSHNSKEAIKAARAVVSSIFLIRHYNYTKDQLKDYIVKNYYPLDFTLDEIRPTYKFSCICQDSVPEAFECFFESDSYESTIRLAVSLGGDCDTQGAIAGAIAGEYYGISEEFIDKSREYLSPLLLNVIDEFTEKYIRR